MAEEYGCRDGSSVVQLCSAAVYEVTGVAGV